MPARPANESTSHRPERMMSRPSTTSSAAPSMMPASTRKTRSSQRQPRYGTVVRKRHSLRLPLALRGVGRRRRRDAFAASRGVAVPPSPAGSMGSSRSRGTSATVGLRTRQPVALPADVADLRVALDRADGHAGRSSAPRGLVARARSRGRSAARRRGRRRRRCRTGCSATHRPRTSPARAAWA